MKKLIYGNSDYYFFLKNEKVKKFSPFLEKKKKRIGSDESRILGQVTITMHGERKPKESPYGTGIFLIIIVLKRKSKSEIIFFIALYSK